ncbi:MAG TPA: class I SAM-dependent methyltransferase [Nocardioides sp.]|nr:class I SAM-dependent methyltransferase [Nocardioides sp.]
MHRHRIAAAYDARAEEYVDLLGSVGQMAARDRATIEQWRDGIDGAILDAGCGPGHWTDLLRGSREGAVLGLDASAGFLASARGRFPRSAFVRADLAALPLADATVDGVLAWYSIIHTPPTGVPAILQELRRVLQPGGSLLLGFFDGPAGEPFDHAVTTGYYWSVPVLQDALDAAGLRVLRAETRQDPGARRRHGELVAQAVVVNDPAPLPAIQSAQETL